jgi:hypothetical protein
MPDNETRALVERIFALQDASGCWNVLHEGDRYYPDCNYYAPNYDSTLWTLILLAELGCDPGEGRIRRPLAALVKHRYDDEAGIFTIGRSHFPIPCLNGNMLFLLAWFGQADSPIVDRVVDFFSRHQRFDDGDFRTPSSFPFYGNRSCYGRHSCYWGVTKLLKGLSFLPRERRSPAAKELLGRCVDFVLLHRVCYRSRGDAGLLSSALAKLTFPAFYRSDVLEILWLLAREGIDDDRAREAVAFLRGKRGPDLMWRVERVMPKLVLPPGKTAAHIVSRRAAEVLAFFKRF